MAFFVAGYADSDNFLVAGIFRQMDAVMQRTVYGKISHAGSSLANQFICITFDVVGNIGFVFDYDQKVFDNAAIFRITSAIRIRAI